MKYKSNARWTKIPDSTDDHSTREEAQTICDLLLVEYGQANGRFCDVRGYCLKTWVTEIEEPSK